MVELSEKTTRIIDEMCETLVEDIVDVAESYMHEEFEDGYRSYDILKHYRKLLEAYEMTKLFKCGHLGTWHGQTGSTVTNTIGNRA